MITTLRGHYRDACASSLLVAVVSAFLFPPERGWASTYDISTPDGSQSGNAAVLSQNVVDGPIAGGTANYQWFAASGPNGLRASVRNSVDVDHVYLGAATVDTMATARADFDDFIVTGPPAASVPATLNLRLDGAFQTIPHMAGGGMGPISSTMSVAIGGFVGNQATNSFAGSFTQTSTITPTVVIISQDPFRWTIELPNTLATQHTGILSPGALPATPGSPTFNVPVGVPFHVGLTLAATVRWTYDAAGTLGGDYTPSYTIDTLSDFSLTFATSGPAFTLPEGYTVNSVSAHVSGNEFMSSPPGDVNYDGLVDIFDVNLVSTHWGETGPIADANGDMEVDIFDINLISANWTAGGGSATAVPEPAALTLAASGVGLLVLGWLRRLS